MRRPALPGLLSRVLAALLVVLATAASAQHDGAVGQAPPPPPGDGRLTVEVVHREDPSEAAGLSIALYALAPDGTPGLTSGETGPDGRFTFEGISTDPAIVYLVGARYRDVPFGERATFAPGETTARVEIEIAAPTERVEGVRALELRARLDWMGDRIVVRERLRLENPGDRVVLLPEETGGPSILVRPLSADAKNFSAGPTSTGRGISFEDGAVRFRGPLYPGEQEVEYVYSLPLTTGEQTLTLPVEIGTTTERVVLVAGTAGLEISGPGLVASNEVVSDGGQALSAWTRGALRAGQRIEARLALPESRIDPTLLSIPRSDVWIELDDTRLSATVDLQLEVPPGAPVSGTPDAPLLHVTLPQGARLGGVDPAAESLGLVPTEDGGFDVVGPIAPGTTSLGYSYRVPARPTGVDLDLRFPREVDTLNVLIADTGVVLESSRLHRRRPFRSGTRNYLHREAFNVEPSEVVDLSLEPLRGAGLPHTASVALTLAAAAAAAFYLSGPLRAARSRALPTTAEASPLEAEREALYADIADLDHDFETGKLERADYEQMRTALRAQAIELLRSEREAPPTAEETASPAAGGAPPVVGPVPVASRGPGREEAPPAEPRTGAFCPACGARVKAEWRFCSHCGEALDPASSEARG